VRWAAPAAGWGQQAGVAGGAPFGDKRVGLVNPVGELVVRRASSKTIVFRWSSFVG
jgi:hypothetical protein